MCMIRLTIPSYPESISTYLISYFMDLGAMEIPSTHPLTVSDTVLAFTLVYTGAVAAVPEDPTGLAGSEVSGEVALIWDDPSDDTITGYKIFRKTGTGAYSTLVEDTASTLQSYTDDTVAEGTEYTYKIQAVNDTGNSADSNEFNITTASTATVPNAPYRINWK